MSNKIETIEGIGVKAGKKLREANIQTTADLLKFGGDKKGRESLADNTGLTEKQILEWVNLADLMRISGVGEEYADLLEEAGVDTVKELATRDPKNLSATMKEINTKKKLSKRNPSPATLEKWVAEAKKLKPMVSH